jgi:hypothetical protein
MWQKNCIITSDTGAQQFHPVVNLGEMGQFRIFGNNLVGKIDLRRIGALAVLTLGIFLAWGALSPSSQVQLAPSYVSSFRTSLSQDGIAIDENNAGRKVYPYSVIPGGVQSAADLKNSLTNDSVVAKHYEDFEVERTHVTRLNQDRLLYVSYRLGDRVFWTKKPLLLPKGEAVITDGEHLARTRCGNRLSEAPAGPVLAAGPEFEAGPPEVAEAFPGVPELIGPRALPFPPLPTSAPPTTAVAPPGTPLSPGGGVIVPPTIPVPGGGSTPPPVQTPEPQMWLMLSAGLTGIWLGRKRRKP